MATVDGQRVLRSWTALLTLSYDSGSGSANEQDAHSPVMRVFCHHSWHDIFACLKCRKTLNVLSALILQNSSELKGQTRMEDDDDLSIELPGCC